MDKLSFHIYPLGEKSCFCTTTRLGGVSKAPFDTLNLSPRIKDDPEAVRENIRRVAEYFGVTPEQIYTAKQVHGTRVLSVQNAKTNNIEGDAIITQSEDIVPGVYTADCFPIGLASQNGKLRAIIHAGWRGTMAGVIKAAVKKMLHYGIQVEELHAVVGPGIGSCCYRVGYMVIDELKRMGLDPRLYTVQRPEGSFLDLRKIIHRRLLEQGLVERSVEHIVLCTSCSMDMFFSHRRDHGDAGRMLSMVFPFSSGDNTRSISL